MRQLLLLIFFVATSHITYSQDEQLKPEAKSHNIEVNLRPLDFQVISINQLRYRWFTAENRALRLGLFLGNQSVKPDDDATYKRFDFSIRPGYEWHLPGTNRLSPYFGVETELSIRNSSMKNESTTAFIREVNNGWSNSGSNQAFFQSGLNFLFGADFYVSKSLYLG
jgi:hypothetical protein